MLNIYKKAVAYWKNNSDLIDMDMKKNPDSYFYWVLVLQELRMYCHLSQVNKEDFNSICKRRGFSTKQKRFMKDALKHMGIGDKL